MDDNFYDRISNSIFYDIGDKLGDIILLCLCWLLCCIPVVTIGPSSSALYYAVNKRFKDGSATPTKDFFHSFKQNLRQGVVITIIVLLYTAATIFNILFAIYGFADVKLPSWYLPFAILLLLPLIFTLTYIAPYLSRFTNTVRGTMFHSFTFSTMHIGHTLLMWVYILVSLALMIFFFPSLLFMPFTCTYLCWRLCEKDFSSALSMKAKREDAERIAQEADAKQLEEDELLLAEITEADLAAIEGAEKEDSDPEEEIEEDTDSSDENGNEEE